ncbi:SDR family NAD(P)-dependent oxidoreductase [Pseudomonas putida]
MKNQAHRKRVIVTGGASGIGYAIAQRFAAAGYRVGIIDKQMCVNNDQQNFDEFELLICADLTRREARRMALNRIGQEWDGLDVLVNNAGISRRETCLEVTPDSWDQTMLVNLKAAFFMVQCCAKIMQRQPAGGSIINTASVSGLVAMPNYIAYNISKAGVIAMTKSFALELAPLVRINSISPGYILTPMQAAEYTPTELEECAAKIPLRRLGEPWEIAELALFLASENATFATGQNFVFDGGETTGGLASL